MSQKENRTYQSTETFIPVEQADGFDAEKRLVRTLPKLIKAKAAQKTLNYENPSKSRPCRELRAALAAGALRVH